MNRDQIIRDLENLYQEFKRAGNLEKAQETLLEISRLKTQQETVNSHEANNLLFG